MLCARRARAERLEAGVRRELGVEVLASVADAIDAIGEFQRAQPSHVVIDGDLDGSGGVRLAIAMHAIRSVPMVAVVTPEQKPEVLRKLRHRSLGDVRVACWADAIGPGLAPPLFAPPTVLRSRPGPVCDEAAVEGYEAIVVLGSAGTPHMLPTLLPSLKPGGVPLVVAVHHNARLSASFAEWVGSLTGASPEPLRGSSRPLPRLTVARAASDTEVLQPDLDGVLLEILTSTRRVLVIVISGMEFEGLHTVRLAVERGADLVALHPGLCPQPAMVQKLLSTGLAPRLCSHAEISELIGRSVRAHEPLRRAC